ncbi:Urea ABC transporter permease protein UrtB [Patulibacter medicamentivorans]|uniref:Urea ABC transporter permease protein UrtB n=1 Tax=Patulibacter medicamentivorans TaxID=1097667 RepID=H0EB17_9ACTN|nr:urea ABC transporter permease subunit UrtB [Patulibacter medicamentivorans]EHN09092.1 Urea ABC transporter permease protein UrtB [Patulibacter medicamentivorans]
MEQLFSQIFVGLSIGSILLLVALGLTFTFGQMGVINMAHGEFIMAGAYTTYVVQQALGDGATSTAFLLSLPAALVVAGLLGLALEALLIRRLYGRPLDTLLVTWGVALILQQLARDLFGAQNVEVKSPGWLNGGTEVLGVGVAYNRIFIMVLALAATAGAWFVVSRMKQGRRMRAVMQNRQLAAASGIGTAAVDRRTFFLGSGLAGVAGVAITQLGSVGPTLGQNYIVDAFLVVVAGGLGKLRGAVIAALVLGLCNSLIEYWTEASLAKVIVFVLIVAFLQLRPQGIVAQETRGLA